MSWLYGIGVRIRMAALRKKGRRLPGFTVSIGNITAGGTGKTPFVIMLAGWAGRQGYNAAVISRGYGGKYRGDSAVVTDGANLLLSPDISGDEPWLMANRLKGIPVIVSRKRHDGGIKAYKSFGSNFFILDDGFQHILLKRDMDIVLADAKSPFGNGHLLPWGPLREPLSGLNRADAFVFTRSAGPAPVFLSGHAGDKPRFTGDHAADKIVTLPEQKEYDASFISGKRVLAFTGIGRPDSFRETLAGLGADIVSFIAFGDHYPFNESDLRDIKKECNLTGADLIITTEKDRARIGEKASIMGPFAFLTVNFVIRPDGDEFFRLIKEKADEVLGKH